MDNTIKVGDLVKVIDASGAAGDYQKGEVGIVERVEKDENNSSYDLVQLKGKRDAMFPKRFKKLGDKLPEVFYFKTPAQILLKGIVMGDIVTISEAGNKDDKGANWDLLEVMKMLYAGNDITCIKWEFVDAPKESNSPDKYKDKTTDIFKFYTKGFENEIYTAEYLKRGGVQVSWNFNGFTGSHVYSAENIRHLVDTGFWIIVQKPKNEPNGVDANGNPSYFDKSMLKSFMRAKVKQGFKGIVAKSNKDGEYFIVDGTGGWVEIEAEGDWSLAEVFDVPTHEYLTLNQEAFGPLIWKDTDKVAEEKVRLEKAVENAREKFLVTQDELDVAKENALSASNEYILADNELKIFLANN